ncbi:MAG: hypothetical protein ACRDSH_13635 [Pseudonocardiaceae bacterium]
MRTVSAWPPWGSRCGASDVAVAENVTWYSIRELAASLARSVELLHFERLLPGHGDRERLPAEEMTRRLHALTARVATLQPRPVDLSATRW